MFIDNKIISPETCYCDSCNLTFGIFSQLDIIVKCPLCQKVIKDKDDTIIQVSKESCQCLKCSIKFPATINANDPHACPVCCL